MVAPHCDPSSACPQHPIISNLQDENEALRGLSEGCARPEEFPRRDSGPLSVAKKGLRALSCTAQFSPLGLLSPASRSEEEV